jgi:hypothetical protein
MLRSNKRRLRFVVGLLVIVILYTVYDLYLITPEYLETTTRKARHVVKFGAVLVAYAAGIFAFAGNSPGWLMQLWHILYAAILLLLILAGIYDGWANGLSGQFRSVTVTLSEFLISPVPYIVIGIMNRATRSLSGQNCD